MRALTLAAEGIHIAREAGDFDLEMLGRDVQGLALVANGKYSSRRLIANRELGRQ